MESGEGAPAPARDMRACEMRRESETFVTLLRRR